MVESMNKGLKRKLIEDVDNFDVDELRFFLEDMLSDNVEDNIAMVAASKVPGYNPDWCNDDAFSSLQRKFAQCRNAYVSSLVDLLTVYR